MLQTKARRGWSPEQLKVLDVCRQIHSYAEEFYQHLAEIHRDQHSIARIWGLLAVDKCNHSDTFKMANRLKGEGISEISMPSETATALLAKMKSIPEGVRSSTPSVLEALRFAIKMEENLTRVHFCHVVRFYSQQDMDMLASSLKSSSGIMHMMTEEYINMTLME